MNTNYMDIIHVTISPCDHERRIFNESVSAARNGYSTGIIALKTPDLPAEDMVEGIPIFRLSVKKWKSGPLKFLMFNWRLWHRLRKSNFGILHVHDVWVLPGAVLANFLNKGKIVYDAHEYIRGLEVFNSKKISGVIWRLTEKILIRRIHYLICINEEHEKLFRESYPNIPASIVLHNYPRLQSENLSQTAEKYSKREDVVIFQGILKKGRGLIQALAAMKSVKQGKLRILGYGELETEIKSFVEQNKLNHKIEFFGKVPLDRLISETQKARAGLVLFEPTSLNYTYASPNKFFEYIMAGTPLIASKIPTFRQLNEEFTVAVLVDPFSPEEISLAIEQLLTDKNYWERLNRNCIKARKKWHWEGQESKLIDLYRSLLSW